MKLLRTLPWSLAVLTATGVAVGFSNAPTFLGHSGLTPPDAGADVNIGLHKAVLSAAVNYQTPHGTEHPANAFDGDDSTSTGPAGNITVDLGAVFVVDSVVVKFTSTPAPQYHVQWSPYLGATDLPPTHDLATGLGSIPAAETPNQEYRDLAWINDAAPQHQLPAQPARFLNFHFLQVFSGQWSNGSVNEIEIHGHPYVPQLGDRAFLSRQKWLPTAYADAAPEGEGQTVTHALDGQLTNVWLPRTPTAPGQWYQLDLGEEAVFDQLFVVFGIGGGPSTPNALNLFASNDAASWGAPIAQLNYGESATASFPLQHARFIRLEQTTKSDGYWQIDELNLLGPVAVDPVVPGAGGAGTAQPGAGTNAVGGSGGSESGSVGGSGATSVASGTAGSAGSTAAGAEGAAMRSHGAAQDTNSCALTPTRRDPGPSLPGFALLALVGCIRRFRSGCSMKDAER